MMDRFGPEIEADLRIHGGGADVLDVYRGRMSIRTALNLIDRCPQASHWREAYLQDEDLVRQALQRENGEPSGPDGTEFTPEIALLTAAVDLLAQLNYTLANLFAKRGQEGKPPEPLPRPVRAIDRVREELEDAEWDDFVARIEAAQATDAEANPELGMTFDVD